jgi:UDP-N-acetylglucosamine--N-acetylmuramyl-(pentapeptide) pyrophosphoryl-undecaprenol N-acetylglucosamine transferase
VIVVVGGSQGARGVNNAVVAALAGARSMVPRWQWVHLTGPADEERVRAAYAAEGVSAVVYGFWDRMELVLGAASAAITRAGASSMAELAAMRIPSVLVPYPHAADNHQFHNACAFESTGAAVLIEQADIRPEPLLAALQPMVENDTVRARMQAALAGWHRPEAAEVVARSLVGPSVQSPGPDLRDSGHGTEFHHKNALVA